MSTGQSYSGKGDSTTSAQQNGSTIEPTGAENRQSAQNADQSTLSQDERNFNELPDPLTRRYNDLHFEVETMTSESGIGSATELMSELLYGWLCNSVDAGRERDIDSGKVYQIREHQLEVIWSALQLMNHQAKLHETWGHIEDISAKQYAKSK